MWHPEHLYGRDGHLDEGVIHAWLDGALDRDAAREVEAHATVCTTCSMRVEEARGFVAGASRILGALDDALRVDARQDLIPPDAPSVAPSDSVRPAAASRGSSPIGDLQTRRRGWSRRRWNVAAAAVFLVAAGSLVLRDRLGGTDGVRDSIVAERQPMPLGDRPVEPAGAATSTPAALPAVPPAQGATSSASSAAAKDAVGGVAGSSGDAPVEPAAQQAVADREARAGVVAAPPAAPAPPPPSAITGLSKSSEPEAVRPRASAQRAGTARESAKTIVAAAMNTACWRVEDPPSVLRLMEAAAPEGGAWQLGERVINEKAEPIRWREEIGTAGRRVRIAEPDSLAGAGLLLLVRGDSLFQMPAGPDRPVGPLLGVRIACR